MLSVDDVKPSPVTSLCRRSSESRDGDENGSSGLTRRGSFRGSMSSLGSAQQRRESIVETLEKKCRENVSNKLRGQLHKSPTNACNDLPVIVRPPPVTTALRGRSNQRHGSNTQPSTRSSCQLYQGLTHASSLQHLNRRHSTTAASEDWTRSLSVFQRTRPHAETTSASSTLVKSSATRDNDWHAGKRATLPTRLRRQQDQPATLRRGSNDTMNQSERRSSWSSTRHDDDGWTQTLTATTRPHPSRDVQRAGDMGSTSPADNDSTAVCDIDPDSSDADTDSCDEESVSSSTFAYTTPRAQTLYGALAESTDGDSRWKELIADDSSEVVLTPSGDNVLQETEDAAEVAETGKLLTNGPAVCSDMTDMNIASDKTSSPHSDETAARLHVQSITTDVIPASCSNNWHYKTTDVNGVAAVSTTTITTSTEGTQCDRARYRTSVSLSLSSPSVSATTTRLVCHSAARQPCQSSVKSSQSSVSDLKDSSDLAAPSSPPPPLPRSAQPNVAGLHPSYTSDDDDDDDDDGKWSEMDDEVNAPPEQLHSPIKHRKFRENDAKTEDQSRINKQHSPNTAAAAASDIKDISNDVTPATTATVRALQCNTGATNADSRTRVSNIVNLSTTPATVNSDGHVVNEQTPCRSTASHNVAIPLNDTDDVLPNTNGLADDQACQKNGQPDVSLVHGSWLSTSSVFSQAVNQHQQPASRGQCFSRQVDEFHGVGGEQATTQQFTQTRQSYVNATRLERPGFSTVTSYSMTSSHTTSGSGPPRPIAVDDSPTTSQVPLIPVQVGGRSQCWAVPGPSVERSWETLRTDSTRSAVIPHKTTSSHRVCTAGPQDKTAVIIPVQHNKNTGQQSQTSSPPSDTTHTVVHRGRSQCGRGHPDQLDIVVIKTGLALGFSIDGGKDSLFGDRPVTVKRVFRDDLRLQAGDEILSANGCTLNDMTHFVALNFLKSLPDGSVRLVVRRV